MAYDQGLAERIRQVLDGRRGVSEKAMFGGACFLVDGKMFVGVVKDELMARVGPDAHDEAVARPHARIMDFTGRPMRGYVFVSPAGLEEDEALAQWIEESLAHVATLDGKKGKSAAKSAAPTTRPGKKATPASKAPERRPPAGGNRLTPKTRH